MWALEKTLQVSLLSQMRWETRGCILAHCLLICARKSWQNLDTWCVILNSYQFCVSNCQVHILETPWGNEYLNATLFPILPVTSEMPHLFLASFPSQSDLTTSHLTTPTNNGSLRNSSAPGALGFPTTGLQRHSSLGPSPAKKRVSAVGTTSSHARLFKLYGDVFLLAGRTQDSKIWSVGVIRSHFP